MKFGSSPKLQRELTETPGVNSYDIYGPPKAKGLGFSNVQLKSIFDCNTRTPGPNSYETNVPVEKRTTSIRFVTSKQGRQPFDPPKPIPGPNSYIIQLPGQPKRMRNLRSASMRSSSKRDSEFTKMTPGPGIGKYVLQTVNKWSQEKNLDANIHTFGPIKDRFANSFQGNMAAAAAVPGPGMYEQKNYWRRTATPLPMQDGQRMYRTKALGKQNELGFKPHTFGADKDRFKDSFYGRLDLIAEAPGVGDYDVKKADRQQFRYNTF